MARRKKTSGAEELMDIVSMLPWRAGAALAIVSFFVLHRVAAAGGDRRADGAARHNGGAELRKVARHIRVIQIESADGLDGMTREQFEQLVGEASRLQGYSVIETGGGGADGSLDIVVRKGNENFVVQCKQRRAFKVGVDVVHELHGVMAAKGGSGGPVAGANPRPNTLLSVCGWVHHRRSTANVDHKNRIRSFDSHARLPHCFEEGPTN